MFTGIIEAVGEILSIKSNVRNKIFTIKANFARNLEIGESVAIDGCCLTVLEKSDTFFRVEATQATLKTTTLQYLKPKAYVNLERALLLKDRLGGHFVLGHIDEIGRIKLIRPVFNNRLFTIETSSQNRCYLVAKGSIAVDGISLTINSVKNNRFSVNIIPHTLKTTTWHTKRVGDYVNVEYDILMKAVNAWRK